MPYIDPKHRERFDPFIATLIFWLRCPITGVIEPGDLNYVISRLLAKIAVIDSSYNDFNAIMGILACVQQEFYRRAVAPYEDQKCKENGDVFNTPK